MGKNKKIYITGCAKTGTTLVRRLFNAFDDLKVYNYDEMNVTMFVNSNFNVAKRTSNAPFSNINTKETTELNLRILQNCKIVNVVRDQKAVLKSDNNYVSVTRYNASMFEAQNWNNHIDFTIVYESLIENPDKIQKEIADVLGLTIKYKWSEYPKFLENIKGFDEREGLEKGIYSLRPIGEKIK